MGGVRFLGATLWTDYRLPLNRTQRQLMQAAEQGLNDHRIIKTQEGTFSAARALEEHEQSKRWLQRQLAAAYDGRTVVVTHHAPHPLSVHPRYASDPLNAAFASDLTELLSLADLWLHGHVHDSFDYKVDGRRVVVNPRGYAHNVHESRVADELVFENPSFQWACVLDV